MRWLISLIPVVLLVATDSGWRTKPATEWSEQDAVQLLSASPWARQFRAGITRRLSEDELRDGGQMGQSHGVGYDGVDPKGSGPRMPTGVFKANPRSLRSMPQAVTLSIRWESALPVRLAELKSRQIEPPTLEGEGYRIAIYGVPGGSFKGDPTQLGEPLRKEAVLRREGKKDVRPIRVEVFQRENGLVVAYLFPLSAEITPTDNRVEFEAHIGRIIVNQAFDLRDMQFQGRLEL